MKRNNVVFLICLGLMLALCGCADDRFADTRTPGREKIELVDGTITLNVSDLKTVTPDLDVRASEPTGDIPEEEAWEKQIDNIWVFQYSSETGRLLYKVYKEITDQEQLNNLKDIHIQLATKANEAQTKSTIHVVANVGNSDVAQSWANNVENKGTLNDLLESNIPQPEPIKVKQTGDNEKVNPDAIAKEDVRIPMTGSIEDAIIYQNFGTVEVPVERMYAKMVISVSINEDKKEFFTLNNIEINSIPWVSRIKTRSCPDGKEYQKEEETVSEENQYAKDTKWITRTITTKNWDENPTEQYIIYVPENIQGENKNKELGKKDTNVPSNSIALKTHFTHRTPLSSGHVSDDFKYAEQPYTYTVYPGGNDINNYNIKRNRVYRVNIKIKGKKSQHTPSSNCFVVEPNQVFAFEPYFRVETGGGYDFTEYLSPKNEKSKIDGIEIIWQTKDCIGDNTNGDLVWFEKTAGIDDDEPTLDEMYKWKIYLKTKKKGNALIGAYNKTKRDGTPNDNYDKREYLWSWHIWCTDHHPDDVDKAITYYTYDWDKDGIKSQGSNNEVRVPGYGVMACNLGALKNEPSQSDVDNGLIHPTDENMGSVKNVPGHKTDPTAKFSNTDTYFGMLYQWGRKDPFPPMMRVYLPDQDYTTETTGMHYRNNNKDEATKSAEDGKDALLFHSLTADKAKAYILDNTQNNTNFIRYSIGNPTVFICGTKKAYEKTLNNVNYCNKKESFDTAPYLKDGDWNQESDDKLWGAETFVEGKFKTYVIEEDPKYGYPDGNKTRLIDNYGTAKSIFDPCPTGWRVPPGEMWIGFTKTGINPVGVDDFNAKKHESRNGVGLDFNGTDDKGFGYGFGIYMYMEKWKEGDKVSYFPTQGSRIPNGAAIRVSWKGCGNYYSANPDKDNRINTLHIHDNVRQVIWKKNSSNQDTFDKWSDWTNYFQPFETLNFMYHCKAAACPIRCVRDTK